MANKLPFSFYKLSNYPNLDNMLAQRADTYDFIINGLQINIDDSALFNRTSSLIPGAKKIKSFALFTYFLIDKHQNKFNLSPYIVQTGNVSPYIYFEKETKTQYPDKTPLFHVVNKDVLIEQDRITTDLELLHIKDVDFPNLAAYFTYFNETLLEKYKLDVNNFLKSNHIDYDKSLVSSNIHSLSVAINTLFTGKLVIEHFGEQTLKDHADTMKAINQLLEYNALQKSTNVLPLNNKHKLKI